MTIDEAAAALGAGFALGVAAATSWGVGFTVAAVGLAVAAVGLAVLGFCWLRD